MLGNSEYVFCKLNIFMQLWKIAIKE